MAKENTAIVIRAEKNILNMNEALIQLIYEYEKYLSFEAAKQYISMLKNYFAPFLMQKYNCNSLKALFCEEITRKGIIEAITYYVIENENISSKSRLLYYVYCLDGFYSKIIFKKFPNPNIKDIYPFTNLITEVLEILKGKGIVLNEKESCSPIDEEQYSFLMKELKDKSASLKSRQEIIITKLWLLYGITAKKISEITVGDYNFERNTLNVRGTKRKDIKITLELPFLLSKEIMEYINIRGLKGTNEMLFSSSSGKVISSNFLNDFLRIIREKYCVENDNFFQNQFTPTGLQKYAIIKMIESGMNQAVIMDLTGQGIDVFSDCQNIVDNRNGFSRNRYINHMIRGIDTYDDM